MKKVMHLAAFLVDLVDGLDGVQMIDTGVEPNLIEHHYPGLLSLLV